ncbi:hypothetical protein Indivirus_5_49 [Indivirus ILV1]|uniref:Uncharacterized protein n=1 Tax=Indivirus ILV1 TaxID=1977633 RepID=A0A1V0SDZ3_9VIRU|nr:hypothetical protein Indivirus_5_49 [Indivirus ILV1]
MSSKKKVISKINTKDNMEMLSVENNISNENTKVVKNKVDKDDNKYKVALKLINKILVNIGKDEINDLTDFKDIDREDIIKDVNKEALTGMEKELFPLFNKDKVGYYRKTNAIVLNCLRGMMKEIGFSLVKVQKGKMIQINGKSYEKSCMIYHIE